MNTSNSIEHYKRNTFIYQQPITLFFHFLQADIIEKKENFKENFNATCTL